MRLYFRQGIARAQTDVAGTSRIFLQRGRTVSNGTFVDLIVAPDPAIVVFAHRDANYVVEEAKTVRDAWGPFTGSQTRYLYWDINRLTGQLTRGSTSVEPILVSGLAPANPVVDQHWFDSQTTTMYRWDGTKWVECIRVFAGTLRSGSILAPYPIGTQAGIQGYDGEFEGGNIVLDAYGKPLVQSNGTFVTSVSELALVANATRKIKFEAEVASGLALEPIPQYSFVQMRPGKSMKLARNSDLYARVSGIVTEDLHGNEVGYLVTEGLVRNPQWSFPESMISRPVFFSATGQPTTTPPTTGVLQVVGFVYDTDSIYMNIRPPVILDPLTTAPPIVTPPVGAPVADFAASPTTGVAPLTVNFTSISTNFPTSYEWDFNNDGTTDATTPTASYVFNTPGIYTVRHVASNSLGSDVEIKVGHINVTAPEPASGFTNLEIRLASAATVVKRGQVFQCQISQIRNDGQVTATNIVVQLTVPDVRGEQLTLTNLPAGTSVSRGVRANVFTLPPLASLASGGMFGPISFTATAPLSDTSAGNPFLIQARVFSPEADADGRDNVAQLDFTVRV